MDSKYYEEIYKVKAIWKDDDKTIIKGFFEQKVKPESFSWVSVPNYDYPDEKDEYSCQSNLFDINVYTLCRNTGIKNRYKLEGQDEYLYEFDLLEVYSGMNNTKEYGYLMFDDEDYSYTFGSWIIKTSNYYPQKMTLHKCNKYKVIGNVILNKNDINIIEQQDEQLKRKPSTVDKEDCRSTQSKNRTSKMFLPR